MPELARPVLFLHVVAAFLYVSGYLGTNLLTELARRSGDPAYRRSALAFSSRFDRLLNAPGGTAAGVTGLLAVWAFGYSLLAPWIVISALLYVAIVLLGTLFWTRFGKRVDEALAAGDEAAVTRTLNDERALFVSRAENVMLLVIIVLMVFRPGS